MKKLFLLFTIIFLNSNANQDKIVKITGAVVAPWVKGDLCISYWYQEEKFHVCRPIQASTDYIFTIPTHVDHIRVRRSFAKECTTKAKGLKKCRMVKGRLNTPQQVNDLDLTYDHATIYKYHEMPPKEAESIYGYPRRNASIRFTDASISDPTAFS